MPSCRALVILLAGFAISRNDGEETAGGKTESAMHAEFADRPLFILVIGLVTLGSLFLRALASRVSLPATVGYLVMGLMLRWQNEIHDYLTYEGIWTLELLGEIGVVFLLFKVGLESNFQGLIKQLPNAVWIWIWNVGLSGVLGFIAARYWLDCGLIPSLFVATALTATSIGVSLSVWEEAGRLRTEMGELVTDAAELDDLSTVALLVLLFAVVPILEAGGTLREIERGLALALGVLVAKGFVFAGVCFLFARYLEKPVGAYFSRHSDPVIFLAGSGLLISAFAGWLGFSAAIGGLFAGMIFSRDPVTVKKEASFEPIHELFKPFFFVAIGFQLNPAVLHSVSGAALTLLLVAVIGKVAGAALPAGRRMGWFAAGALGASMVPRAEIAMVVAQSGNSANPPILSDEIYASLVLVCLATCLLTPPILQWQLARLPEDKPRT